MMNSHCIARCISDVHTAPIRPTYRNLYKWPESDAEFMRSVSKNSNSSDQSRYPRVVESISCRQMYLRSYTFSTRKETVQEKITRKCFRKTKEGVAPASVSGEKKSMSMRLRGGGVFGKEKQISCGAFLSVFRRMLVCGATVHDL
ncbi:hypothetical protein QQ045_004961 [Rhodiola kirilowii]